MTQTLVTTRVHDTHQPDIRGPVMAAVALSAAMTAILVARDFNDGPAWRVSLVLGAVVAAASGILFGVTVPRTLAKQSAGASGRAALVLGVLTLVSVLAFWAAVPPVFAGATLILASDAREPGSGKRERRAYIGAAVAAVGCVASVLLCVAG